MIGIYKRTAEHNRKISESHKGDKNPNFGKSPSVESQRKRSESLKAYYATRSPDKTEERRIQLEEARKKVVYKPISKEHAQAIVKALTTHGMSKTSIYKIWHGIISRCRNPNRKEYKNYGGRGITVCDSWLSSFETFLSDMGDRPGKNYSIDRIDNEGGYSPDNCRWVDSSTNNANKRATGIVKAIGVNIEKRTGKYIWCVQRNGKRLRGRCIALEDAIEARKVAHILLYPDVVSVVH